jgi:hypothetical protein
MSSFAERISLEFAISQTLGRVKRWYIAALRHVRYSIIVASVIIVSMTLCLQTQSGRTFVQGLNSSLNPMTIQLQAPPPGIPTQQFLSVNTFNRSVLRNFILTHNKKVYDRLVDEIIDACIANAYKYRLSPILVLSLIQVESEFNVNATSPIGAVGLTQVNPKEWLDVLITKKIVSSMPDCYDPAKNIEAGCFILRHYLDQTQNFELALDKYLGTQSNKYRDDVHRMVGSILMMGITYEINASYRAPGRPAG